MNNEKELIEFIKKSFKQFVIPKTNNIVINTDKDFFDSVIDVYYKEYKHRKLINRL